MKRLCQMNLILSVLGLSLLSGCRKATAPAPAAGIPEVKVISLEPTSLPLTIEEPGRLEAFRQAEVRARVPGIVMKRPYEEGQEVKAGTPLFLIDPAPLQAEFDAADAALAEAIANHALATDKLERYQNLIASSAISARDLQESVSEEKQAAAKIASAKANKETAKLKLEYATVVSPIDGRARRAQVTEGALVGEGSATLLTTVEQIDPIYVNFSQPASEVIALRDSITNGTMDGVAQQEVKVELILGDGSVHPQQGKLLFADLAVDPGTDSIAMRAVFPNAERKLLPGMYVRVKLDRAMMKNAILLPRVALVRNTEGAQVMALNENDEVMPLNVKADTMRGDHWLVTSGLKGGETIIIENAAMMVPGSKVKGIRSEVR